MPTIFEDSDGMIVEYNWFFEGGVNMGGSGMTLTSDFSATESILQNPVVGWLEPGLKNVTLEVTDDDGNSSTALLVVQVFNQRPVAVFSRPADGTIDTQYTFISQSFDPDGDDFTVSVYSDIMSESILEDKTTDYWYNDYLPAGVLTLRFELTDSTGMQRVHSQVLTVLETGPVA